MTEIKPEQKLDPKVATDFPKFIATSIADQIKQADTKAFGTISIIGITTAALLSRLAGLKATLDVISPVWLLLFVISIGFIFFALKAAVLVVYPRLTTSKKEDMTYFLDISSMTKEEFLSLGKSLTTEGVIEATYKNAYNLSHVAAKKYKALRKAMIFTLIALVWAIGVILFS